MRSRRIRHRRQCTRHLITKRRSTTLREVGATATLTKVDAPSRNALNRNMLSRNVLSLRITKSHAARNRAVRNRAHPATCCSPERAVLVDSPVGRI